MHALRTPAPSLILKLTVIALGVALISHADSGEVSAATVTVNVGDFWFCNSSFSGSVCPTSIRTGDSVTWNWVGTNSHSTTACSDATFTTCGAAQGWDSGIKTTGTFSMTFNNAGTFYYHCEVHPTLMQGKIGVILDSDHDGWSDAAENIIGTNPLLACGTNAWPPDINNDTFVDISDITLVTGHFGEAVTTATKRLNIAPDPPDGFIDITDITRLTGLFSQHCTP